MSEDLHRTQRLLGEAMSNIAALQERCNQLQHERDEAVILAGKSFDERKQAICQLHGVLQHLHPKGIEILEHLADEYVGV